ncbi:MAG: BadF/BadG/BcrA/BcrD ATPase family protein [Bacteroidales bacterium]|nr:BadF/BadG/BcrA/BcrD ATPase family protein [Bacteroidales bacterium]MDD4823328.1 BadF/BadG/BcrA/BcrD ATPase family protein [Bacteroidales bacterium]
MKLVADSGSTKTQWTLFSPDMEKKEFLTAGINPYYQSQEEIADFLSDNLKFTEEEYATVSEIHFYGAGCADETKNEVVRGALCRFFPKADIEVQSDLLGAARALFGHTSGIACILGTGSNSCYYDGEIIVKNITPLGFILGDEGSGAVLGRQLIADYMKRMMPLDVSELFYERFRIDRTKIMESVYRRPFPNRFMASFAPFLSMHRDHPYIQQLILDGFDAFFRRNVMQYDYQSLSAGFIGSVGYSFQRELTTVASRYGIRISEIHKSPIDGLISYHS